MHKSAFRMSVCVCVFMTGFQSKSRENSKTRLKKHEEVVSLELHIIDMDDALA